MRQYAASEPLRVQAGPRGRPHTFAWHGETHVIQSVEDIQEPRLDWWAPDGEIHRLYYLVVTHRGLICEICHDLVDDAWRLSRSYD